MRFNIIKTNNPVKKMGRRPKQTFLQRRHTDGQKACEKMLNITNNQRNTNLYCNEIPPVRKTIIKKRTKKPTNNKCWRGCRETGIILHLGLECKLI